MPAGKKEQTDGKQALAQGTKEIPQVTGDVSATWHSEDAAPAPPAASTEVEMGDEAARRGERDEEE